MLLRGAVSVVGALGSLLVPRLGDHLQKGIPIRVGVLPPHCSGSVRGSVDGELELGSLCAALG